MSNNTSEVFSIEEVTLENSHLLPQGPQPGRVIPGTNV
jgi:hypothetical protein